MDENIFLVFIILQISAPHPFFRKFCVRHWMKRFFLVAISAVCSKENQLYVFNLQVLLAQFTTWFHGH